MSLASGKSLRVLFATVTALLLGARAACAQDLMDILDDDDDLGAELVDEILKADATPADLDKLDASVFTDVCTWPDVRPSRPAKDAAPKDYPWASVHQAGFVQYASIQKGSAFPPRQFAQPLRADPIAVKVEIPEAGEYRVWLAQLVSVGRSHPVTLRITEEGGALSHRFGTLALPGGKKGRDIEQQFPVKFESEAVREFPVFEPAVTWEFWDTTLAAGTHNLELVPGSLDAKVESVFISRSKAFTPSKAMPDQGNTLTRSYYRYRVTDAPAGLRAVKFKSFVLYQWARYRYNFDKRIFYGSMGNIRSIDGRDQVAVGEWSDWVDVTESATSSGRYATDSLKILDPSDNPLTKCALEVQFAWYPHAAAAIRTLKTSVFEGATFYTFPAQYLTYKAPAVPEDTSTGLQGVRDATYVSHFESEAEVLQRILAPMDAPEYAQGATPRLFRLYTLCRVSPGRYDDAVPRLKKVGINWIDGIPLDVKTRYGLITDISSAMQSPRFRADTHCPLDPTVEDSLHELFEQQAVAAEANDPEYRNRVSIMKMGDEIGPVSGPIFVNGLSDCRKAFHSYLAEILAREGESPSFFGVTDLDQVDYAVSLPADAGRYQKRVYYHSCLFRWMLTSTFYERYTKAVSRVYPNVRTSCNYTPGSFMHAGIMHTSDWFALSRYGGATMSWGEDWLGGTGWYAMAGLQTVGYYGAIVECAARKRGLPSGFYLVGRTGSIDRKMLSLAARGIQMIYLYNWGPEYTSGAVDTFSHLESTYPEIGRGARALGLIDETLARGSSAPRKVALLYNQSHEFWNGAYAGMHFDRLLTFLALQHAHVPVNLILEEDLSPEVLSQYQVLYINGFNLQRRHLAAISDWVKAGGMLYASSGAAMFDEYNDPAPEAEELLGARQQIAGMSEGEFRAIDITDHEPIDTLQIEATDLTPSLAVPVVGLKIVLTPTTGQPIARYADGSVGAVRREFGRGKVLLLGVMPGHLYRHNAPRDENLYPTLYTQERRDLITLAATRTLPAPDVTYSDPLVEVTLIEDEEALAVLLNDFSYAPGRDGELRVRTDRKIGSVVSNVRGPIDWRRDGDHIVIPAPVPDPVESILLR